VTFIDFNINYTVLHAAPLSYNHYLLSELTDISNSFELKMFISSTQAV